MKAVILTGDGPQHKYVVNELDKALGDRIAAIIVEKNSKKTGGAELLKLYRRYGLLRIIERLITKVVRKILKTQIKQEKAFKELLNIYNTENKQVTVTDNINSEENVKYLKSIQPDYIFVYGTGIVKQKILSLPKIKSLNLHTGYSPEYRGAGTVYWPFYNYEPDMVGVTVHECSSAVDGGRIYARKKIALSSEDNQFTAYAKAVREGASLYGETARKLMNGQDIETVEQDLSCGKEYRFKDWTFVHEIKMALLNRTGKIKKMLEKGANQ